jgi:alanyl-tRNA synthetase
VTGDELRHAFLGFFEDRGHKIIPSSSLVPHKDPSLLLTSAGMVQVKPYYLGLETPPSQRLASCQKCFRTTDIDAVGDSKHLTFFEMLGNFSVGDYFKKETISWAWDFVTRHLKLPEERLWITIYLDDDESFAYWREIGVPPERILRFGESDNFWGPVGDSGPCGPCSEIHYDLGEEFGCGRSECKPNCECGRFCEIWNLVFTQYNQDQSGRRTPLPRPNIDTGMGLERTLAALQRKSSPYETSVFSPFIDRACELSGREYGRDENVDRAIRIVAEHSRGIAFLIADGVMPSNERRGYVLRRIIRRASLFGKKLGLNDPFLGEMADIAITTMSHIYPELAANRSLITEVTKAEEEKFIATLDTGLSLVERLIGEAASQVRRELTGEEVFRLYDTYGFPPELTAEIAKENGLSVDWEGFRAAMQRQRTRARGSKALRGVATHGIVHKPTKFIGYRRVVAQSKVLELRVEGQSVDTASQGDEIDLVLDKTPFYGEMGGQVGDTGEISSSRGKAVITNTTRTTSGVTVHMGRVVEGVVSVGDRVETGVDVARRLDIARNHTATHLLQAALRQTLGSGISQKGSLVEPGRFRFDFSYGSPVSKEELTRIETQVNDWIRRNLSVAARIVPYRQALAEGAIALFEEKYGEEVRMLEIGRPAMSKELCGGTHVSSTGEIGFLLITVESSIGTGLHRIEAVTGRNAEALVGSRFGILQDTAREVESSPEEVPGKVKSLIAELEAQRRRALSLERELSQRIADGLLGQAEKVNGVTILAVRVPALTMPVLREMSDILRDRLKSAIVVLATIHNDKPSFLATVTSDLVAAGFHAGDIISQVAKVAGGGGGGKPGMAQAGGKDASKIDDALALVRSLVTVKNHRSPESKH